MYIICSNHQYCFGLPVLSIPYLLGLKLGSWSFRSFWHKQLCLYVFWILICVCCFVLFHLKRSEDLFGDLYYIMTIKLTKEDFKWSLGQAWLGEMRHFLTVGISFFTVQLAFFLDLPLV